MKLDKPFSEIRFSLGALAAYVITAFNADYDTYMSDFRLNLTLIPLRERAKVGGDSSEYTTLLPGKVSHSSEEDRLREDNLSLLPKLSIVPPSYKRRLPS